MGNASINTINSAHAAQLEDFGLHSLPDEILALIVDYIDFHDYISLIMACKYSYNSLFGANNLLWCYACKSIGGVNYVFKSLQFLKRWKDNGQIDLTQALDLTDRKLIDQLDMRVLIREYNYHIVTKDIIRKGIMETYTRYYLSDEGKFYSKISIEKYNVLQVWTLYYVNSKAKSANYNTDFYYLVDLQDFVKTKGFTKDKLEKFPYVAANRLVAYVIPWYSKILA